MGGEEIPAIIRSDNTVAGNYTSRGIRIDKHDGSNIQIYTTSRLWEPLFILFCFLMAPQGGVSTMEKIITREGIAVGAWMVYWVIIKVLLLKYGITFRNIRQTYERIFGRCVDQRD